ncbi:DUF7536 family protein [Halobaculum magnesiiphilum]|uniref:Uncharacterized protein n=1 Tax=Halobaculum magnesiiphilum TaxID=1017351 RepID=A0A8T8WBN1_9EURY|nr:hypothetical protein [Halobaculum magnesiiphilum]QZP37226.1 hypothetical protein K6T50_13205 [Halobaculum magnesiiphilum]
MSEQSRDTGDESAPAESRPDRPPITGLVETLSVKRNVAVGAAVGVALAVAVYAVRALELLGPVGGTREYPVLGPDGYFLLLAFVLASSTTLLVASVLTVVSAVRALRAPDTS